MRRPEARPPEGGPPPGTCSHSPPARRSSFKSLSHPVRGEGQGQPMSSAATLSRGNSQPCPWGVGGGREVLTFHLVPFDKEEKEKC